ncbi:MAG: phospholipase D-like domain-containing protein [Treponema sp.]|nr:phospholipase D-like domain-containing protein [Treponema sp.]
MIKDDIKTNYLSYEIINAINSYNLTKDENVFSKAKIELKKNFPSCSEEEINKFLNIILQIDKNKKTEKSKIVFTGPTSFLLKQTKIWEEVKTMFTKAERSITLTGYSVSDYFDEMLEILIQKSMQGIYINLYINEYEKHEEVLKKLIAYKTGNSYIRIYKYNQPEDDKMAALHAKMIVVDGCKSLISSANLSYHGMEGNIEAGIYIESEEKGREIEELLKNLKRLKVFTEVRTYE